MYSWLRLSPILIPAVHPNIWGSCGKHYTWTNHVSLVSYTAGDKAVINNSGQWIWYCNGLNIQKLQTHLEGLHNQPFIAMNAWFYQRMWLDCKSNLKVDLNSLRSRSGNRVIDHNSQRSKEQVGPLSVTFRHIKSETSRAKIRPALIASCCRKLQPLKHCLALSWHKLLNNFLSQQDRLLEIHF